MIKYQEFFCAILTGLSALAILPMTGAAATYTLSPDMPSYEHFVQQGSNVPLIMNTYIVEVPSGWLATVNLTDTSWKEVNSHDGSHSYLVNGTQKGIGSTNRFVDTGRVELFVTVGEPDVAGFMPTVPPTYYYYSKYSYAFAYKISVKYTPPSPDLQIAACQLSSSALAAGKSATITTSVKNAGTASSSSAVLGLYSGSRLLASAKVPALPIGATSVALTLTIPANTLPEGKNILQLKVDPDNAVKEFFEDNNTRSITVTQARYQVPEKPLVKAASDADGVTLTWEPVARAESYAVKRRKKTQTAWSTIKTAATSPYVDATASPGVAYEYCIVAKNEIGDATSSAVGATRKVLLSADAGPTKPMAERTSGSVSVTCNGDWTATANKGWLTLEKSSGSGKGLITYSCAENTTTADRPATITISCGGVTQTVTIVQEGRREVAIASGSVKINTSGDIPSFDVVGGKSYSGWVEDGIAVFPFVSLEIAKEVAISVSGTRPLKIAASTDMTIAADIDVSGSVAGRCGGGVGGRGGAGGAAVSGGSGGGGGRGGEGGTGACALGMPALEEADPGCNGGSGSGGADGAVGKAGSLGSSATVSFGAQLAVSGGRAGEGGNAGMGGKQDANGGTGSLGAAGAAGTNGLAGGNGSRGDEGTTGCTGLNNPAAVMKSVKLVAGAAGGGGGGGGSGGGGGGAAGGGGGAGGSGISKNQLQQLKSENTDIGISIGRGAFVGGCGGGGGAGGTGGAGGSSGGGGRGGVGGNGGGAIMLLAKGVLRVSGVIDVSASRAGKGAAGNSPLNGSPGSPMSQGRQGEASFSSLSGYRYAGADGWPGGDGGNGGKGGNGGAGGRGGDGGCGAPGMVRLAGSLVLARGCRILADNGDGDTSSNRCGVVTYFSNQTISSRNAERAAHATTLVSGDYTYSPLTMPADYDETLRVPIVGELADVRAGVSGICASSGYALGRAASLSTEESRNGLELRRLSGLYSGFDQIFVKNASSVAVDGMVWIGESALALAPIGAGRSWTTCVKAGTEVSLYAEGERPKAYVISYRGNGGSGSMPSESCAIGKVVQLTRNGFSKSGKRFAGWACSNGKRYDDGMLVFNLAEPGETVTMTAIWE